MSSYLQPVFMGVLACSSFVLIVTGIFMIVEWEQSISGYFPIIWGSLSFTLVMIHSFSKHDILTEVEEKNE